MGPTASPALRSSIQSTRWWHPLDEKPGPNPVARRPLPWTGDFLDGLGITSVCWPMRIHPNIANEQTRADGYGIVRF